jgi:hypothetical protein
LNRLERGAYSRRMEPLLYLFVHLLVFCLVFALLYWIVTLIISVLPPPVQ